MTTQQLVTLALGSAGTICAGIAVAHERLMHRHRQPGVTYAMATLRRDGGWRRTDLFTSAGLRHQARASLFGVSAAALWLLSLGAWVLLGR